MKIRKYINFDNLIYIFFGIYISTLLLGLTTICMTNSIFSYFIKSIRYICYVYFIVKIIIDWKNGENITWSIIILGIISILIFIFSKDKNVLFLTLVLCTLRKTDINKIIKTTLNIYIVLFSIILMLSLLNIIPDWIYYRGEIIRHSLGFYYPTITIGIYLSIILMYFYTKKSKAHFTELLILELVNCFLYSNTNGRLSFILITVILITMCIAKLKFIRKIFDSKLIQKIIKIICYILPTLILICVILLTYLYSINNQIGTFTNKLLSSRLKYAENALETYDLNPFGQEVKWHGWGGYGYVDNEDTEDFEYNYVDISYIRMLFDYGIIFSVLIIVAYTTTLVRKYKQKDYYAVFTIFFILIWAFVEPYIINIERNIFVLWFIPLLNFGNIKQLNYKSLKEKIKG